MESAVAVHRGERSAFQLFETGSVDPNHNPEERIAYLAEKKRLAKELGLNSQVEMLQSAITMEKGVRLTVEPMSEDEVTIWAAFLPTTYTATPARHREKHLDGYRFDHIPLPVLEQWNKLRAAGIYESFEIWTPEEVKQEDPVLIGVIGERFYMLARWAESDSNLLSIEALKRTLFRKWFAENWWGVPFAGAIFSAVAGAVMHGNDLDWMKLAKYEGLGAIAYLSILSFFIYIGWKDNRLMQAIRRHNRSRRLS